MGQGFWDAELRYRTVNARLAEINGIPAADAHRPHAVGAARASSASRSRPRCGACSRPARPSPEIDFAGETPAEPGVRRHWVVSFFPVHDGVGARGLRRHRAPAGGRARARGARGGRDRPGPGGGARARERGARLLDAHGPAAQRAGRGGRARARRLLHRPPRGRDGIEPVAVAVADPAQEELARALADRQAADPRAPVGPAAVARTGVAEINASITAADLIREGVGDEERELLGRLGIRSAVILPLTARGTVLGALTLAMGNASGRVHQAELVELASSVAAGAGLALDNARLFAEQAAVTAALQRTLLPAELPEVPGVRLAARYRAVGPQQRRRRRLLRRLRRGRRRMGARGRRRRRQGRRGGGDHRARARHAAGRGPARRRAARGARAGRRGAAPAPRDRVLLRGARPHARRATAASRSSCWPPGTRRRWCCAPAARSRRSARGARCSASRPSRRSARSSSGSSPATSC